MQFKNISLLTLGAKCNFLNLIGHLQILYNHILAYRLFTIPQNMYMELKLQVSEKKHDFRTLYDPRDKNKNSKTLLHIYKIYSSIFQSINCLLFEM